MTNKSIVAPASVPQEQFLLAEEDIVFYGGAAGGGKVQSNDSLIQTPTGTITMSEVKVGDIILGVDGESQKAIAKYPHKNWKFNRITFSDGSSTEAGDEHLWTVFLDGVKTTIDTTRVKELISCGKEVSIQTTSPVKYDGFDVEDAYLVGKSLDVSKDSLKDFLLANLESRELILKGFLEANGGVIKPTYTNILQSLTKLVQSLGGIVEDGLIKLPEQGDVFRRFKSIEYSRHCDGACITVSNPDRLYLTDDFIVTHNSFAGLAFHLKHIQDPNYKGVVVRRTTPMLMKSGAVWDEAKDLYRKVDSDCRIRIKDLKIIFRTNAEVAFSHFERADNTDNWQGSQLSAVVMDELTHFEESQMWYLISRLRSKAKMKPVLRATMNPDPDSWVDIMLTLNFPNCWKPLKVFYRDYIVVLMNK